MNDSKRHLILKQIKAVQNEILLVVLLYVLVYSIILFLIMIGYKFLLSDTKIQFNNFIEFLKALTAILVPSISLLANGFFLGKWRKLNTLQYLFYKENLSEKENEIIYDK